MNANTLVSVHCYSGDLHQVEILMPYIQHHECPVVIVSPTDSPAILPGVDCRQAGLRAYVGQVSLDRQRAQLELLATYPQEWFLANDSDSICLVPEIPRYLFRSKDIFWSNEVLDWRTHPTPYPKLALQPPYFFHRNVLLRMLTVPREKVMAHEITPFIDYYMLQLTEEAGIKHESFPDGTSCGTSHDEGLAYMTTQIYGPRSKCFLHSIKTRRALKSIVEARTRKMKRKKPKHVFNRQTRLFEIVTPPLDEP